MKDQTRLGSISVLTYLADNYEEKLHATYGFFSLEEMYGLLLVSLLLTVAVR